MLYLPSLDNGLSLDDFNWLERVRHRPGVVEFVFAREPGQTLNPVPRALLLLGDLGGLGTRGYHWASYLLHLGNVALLGLLAGRIAGRGAGLVAALLFALHPGYHEAVFWLAAFPHPLTCLFYLGALLLALLGDTTASSTSGRWAPIAFSLSAAGALLTKVVAFALLPAVLLLGRLRRVPAWLCPAALVTTGSVLAANLLARAHRSYLIERGYYAFGAHWMKNLWAYLGQIGFPYAELCRRLDLSGWIGPLSIVGALLASTLLVLLLARPSWAPRWFAVQILLCLAPFLPFVFEPVSRYLYLAVAMTALAVGTWLGPRLERPGAIRPRLAFASIGIVVLLASWAELRLVDNAYEYRERQMQGWIDRIDQQLGRGPVDGPLAVIGLPTLGIDPGIHLEAALRLRRSDPGLRLEVFADSRDVPADWRGPRVSVGDPRAQE